VTAVTRVERYESIGCIDREDAAAMGDHLNAIAVSLTTGGGSVSIDRAGGDIGLHYARLVRIVQRCTQPDVIARAPCAGVDGIVLDIENGRRRITIRTQRADMILDMATRRVTLEERVVEIAPYLRRRA